jgi:type IV pilus assembly protein PilW
MTTKFSPGFSLVELMVALVISSILMGGILTIMSSSKKTYTLQSEFSALQDNARFLIDELTYKIRMAGYSGYSQDPEKQTNPFAFSQNIALGSPPSDQLVIVSLGEILPLAPGTPIVFDATTISLDPGLILPPSLAVGSTIQIADCTITPTAYTVTGINGNVLTLGTTLAHFGDPVQVQVFNGFQEIIYQVQTDRTSGSVGLYKCQDSNPNGKCDDPTQLNNPFVEGVQSMQVRYGIASDGNIQFKPTTVLGDKVVAVRISLLMRTPKKRGIPSTTDKVFYLDPADPAVTYNPHQHLDSEEGFRHRLFTTTIQVRNSTI